MSSGFDTVQDPVNTQWEGEPGGGGSKASEEVTWAQETREGLS